MLNVQASPQKGAGAVCVQATPLADPAGVAALHIAGGCYSPPPPHRSTRINYPNGSTIKLGADTNGDSHQHDGRRVDFGTASYVAAGNGPHQPPGGGAVPLHSALVPPPPRNPLDFYLVNGVPVDGEFVRNRIARQIDVTSMTARGVLGGSLPSMTPIAQNPGTRQMAGQMAVQAPVQLPVQTPVQTPFQTPVQTPVQMPVQMPDPLPSDDEADALASLLLLPTPPTSPTSASSATRHEELALIGQIEKNTKALALSSSSGRTDNKLYELALRLEEASPDVYVPGATLSEAAKQLAIEWVIAQGSSKVLGKRCRSRKGASHRRHLRAKRDVENLRALLEAPARV